MMKPSLKFLNVWPSPRGLRALRGFRGVGSLRGQTMISPPPHGDDERVGSHRDRSWWQTYMTLWRHLFARLTYIHTQIAFWERQGATQQLRSDVHRAVVCLHNQDLDGALDALPVHRVPPNEASGRASDSPPCECDTR